MRSRSGTRFLSPAARLGLAGNRSATSADESLAPSAAAEASANASRSGAGASARSNAVAAARSRVARAPYGLWQPRLWNPVNPRRRGVPGVA